MSKQQLQDKVYAALNMRQPARIPFNPMVIPNNVCPMMPVQSTPPNIDTEHRWNEYARDNGLNDGFIPFLDHGLSSMYNMPIASFMLCSETGEIRPMFASASTVFRGVMLLRDDNGLPYCSDSTFPRFVYADKTGQTKEFALDGMDRDMTFKFNAANTKEATYEQVSTFIGPEAFRMSMELFKEYNFKVHALFALYEEGDTPCFVENAIVNDINKALARNDGDRVPTELVEMYFTYPYYQRHYTETPPTDEQWIAAINHRPELFCEKRKAQYNMSTTPAQSTHTSFADFDPFARGAEIMAEREHGRRVQPETVSPAIVPKEEIAPVYNDGWSDETGYVNVDDIDLSDISIAHITEEEIERSGVDIGYGGPVSPSVYTPEGVISLDDYRIFMVTGRTARSIREERAKAIFQADVQSKYGHPVARKQFNPNDWERVISGPNGIQCLVLEGEKFFRSNNYIYEEDDVRCMSQQEFDERFVVPVSAATSGTAELDNENFDIFLNGGGCLLEDEDEELESMQEAMDKQMDALCRFFGFDVRKLGSGRQRTTTPIDRTAVVMPERNPEPMPRYEPSTFEELTAKPDELFSDNYFVNMMVNDIVNGEAMFETVPDIASRVKYGKYDDEAVNCINPTGSIFYTSFHPEVLHAEGLLDDELELKVEGFKTASAEKKDEIKLPYLMEIYEAYCLYRNYSFQQFKDNTDAYSEGVFDINGRTVAERSQAAAEFADAQNAERAKKLAEKKAEEPVKSEEEIRAELTAELEAKIRAEVEAEMKTAQELESRVEVVEEESVHLQSNVENSAFADVQGMFRFNTEAIKPETVVEEPAPATKDVKAQAIAEVVEEAEEVVEETTTDEVDGNGDAFNVEETVEDILAALAEDELDEEEEDDYEAVADRLYGDEPLDLETVLAQGAVSGEMSNDTNELLNLIEDVDLDELAEAVMSDAETQMEEEEETDVDNTEVETPDVEEETPDEDAGTQEARELCCNTTMPTAMTRYQGIDEDVIEHIEPTVYLGSKEDAIWIAINNEEAIPAWPLDKANASAAQGSRIADVVSYDKAVYTPLITINDGRVVEILVDRKDIVDFLEDKACFTESFVTLDENTGFAQDILDNALPVASAEEEEVLVERHELSGTPDEVANKVVFFSKDAGEMPIWKSSLNLSFPGSIPENMKTKVNDARKAHGDQGIQLFANLISMNQELGNFTGARRLENFVLTYLNGFALPAVGIHTKLLSFSLGDREFLKLRDRLKVEADARACPKLKQIYNMSKRDLFDCVTGMYSTEETLTSIPETVRISHNNENLDDLVNEKGEYVVKGSVIQLSLPIVDLGYLDFKQSEGELRGNSVLAASHISKCFEMVTSTEGGRKPLNASGMLVVTSDGELVRVFRHSTVECGTQLHCVPFRF